MEVFRLVGRVVMEGAAEVNQQLKNMDTGAQKMGKSFERAGQIMSKTGRTLSLRVTAPIVGLGAAIVKTGADYESQMARVQAISGATGDEFIILSEKVREMGRTTSFSATQAAEGMEYLAMAGWETTEMVEGLEPILRMAEATQMDLARASDIVSDMMSAFGMEAHQAGEITDVLAKTASTANTDVGMLGETMKYAAPLANSLGWNIQDVAGAAGLLADNGIKAGQAGTTLNMVMQDLTSMTDNTAKAYKELGIEVFDSQGNMRELHEIISMVENATKDMTAEQRNNVLQMAFNSRSLRGMNTLLNEGGDRLRDYTSEIYDSSGATEEMGEIMRDTLSYQLKQLRSALEGAALDMADVLVPIIRDTVIPMLESFMEWLGRVTTAFSELDPAFQKIILGGIGAVAALGPLLMIFGPLVVTVGKLIPMLYTMGTAILAAGAAFAPFLVGGVIIAGIAAIVNGVIGHRRQTRLLKEDVADLTEEQREQHSAWLQQQADWLDALAARAEQQGRAGAAARTEYAAWEERHKQFKERLEELDALKDKEKEHQKAIEDSTIALGDHEEAYAALLHAQNEFGELFKEVIGENVDLSELSAAELMALWTEYGDELLAKIMEREQRIRKEKEETTEHDGEEEEKKAKKQIDIWEMLTEKYKEQIERRKTMDADYEEKLFQLTATREDHINREIEMLEEQMEEELAIARRIGAETETIKKYFTQRIINLEEELSEISLEETRKRIDDHMTQNQSLYDAMNEYYNAQLEGEEEVTEIKKDQLQERWDAETEYWNNWIVEREEAEAFEERMEKARVARIKYNKTEEGKLWNEQFKWREEEEEKAANHHKEMMDKMIAAVNKYMRTAQQIFGQLNAIWKQYLDNQLTRLNQEEERRLEVARNTIDNEEDLAEREKEIREDVDKERRKIERQQAIRERAAALFSIAINTARAVVQALPNFIVAAIVGAMGVAQAGLVLAEPLPALDKGGKLQKDQVIQAHAQEAIIPLNERVYNELGAGITRNMPGTNPALAGNMRADITLEIDGRKLVRLTGVHLIDYIRDKTGLR